MNGVVMLPMMERQVRLLAGISLAVILAVVLLLGCGPAVSLNRPTCLVVHGDARLRQTAIDGVHVWSYYIKNIPEPLVVSTPDECRSINPPILVRATCGKNDLAAQVKIWYWGYDVVINETYGLRPSSAAHEYAHIWITLFHIRGRLSLLNPALTIHHPTPEDVALLCAAHPELKCTRNTLR